MWMVVSKVISRYGEFHKEKVSKKMRHPRFYTFKFSMPVDFFDGASKEEILRCEARAVSNLNHSSYVEMKMGCGRGANNHGELFALWCLLFYANSKQGNSM